MQNPNNNPAKTGAVVTLTDADLDQYLKNIDVLSIMEKTFAAFAKGQVVQPSQTLTLFPEDRGDFITYQGALSHFNVFGAKLSPYIPTAGAPIITAWTMLMSMETGLPLLLCDSGRLTRERTAATTALAVKKLAPAESKILTIIGTGAIGKAHLMHTLKLRDWQEIRLYSLDLVRDTEKQQAFKAIDSRIVVCDSAKAAVHLSDVVMLCTSSGKPVIDVNDIGKQALITSISTNVAQAHEIDPKALNSMHVYCDYKATTPASAGEMVLAARDHGWSAGKIVGDLTDLCSPSPIKPAYDKSIFFRSIGLGIEDIAIAYAIYSQF
ncbi:ornithine cyclodeaminase family protein [Zophobihabitans entericus]|uniref:Ornithine cyclodeaminase family protein n=2 Tax=Zophobihabitans entericus TaxID=1635327 RepID=A0A6G9I868_9GAMM|nr:ornithine cyclodeaminase family protein [Zophobihabitans entericus]QIQ20405.1 ornithine cyclodeaminase family protein [Zophobihabitans entericus]